MVNFGESCSGRFLYSLWSFGHFWQFGIFCGHLEYIFPFWNVEPRQIWQPCFIPKYKLVVKINSLKLKQQFQNQSMCRANKTG
jgi:hypothetical protein